MRWSPWSQPTFLGRELCGLAPWLLIVLAGCMVGPDYAPPQIEMPAEFAEMRGTEVSESDLYQWWKRLNDPLLDSLLQEAASANYDVRIAVERIIQARAQYRIEGSYLWPEFDINATGTRSRNSQNFFGSATSILPTYQDFFQIGFDAIWELDVWGKFRRSKRAAYYEWEAYRDDAQNVLLSVLSETARNYVAIRALQQQIDLMQSKIKADETEVELGAALLQSGLNSEIQMDNLIATLENDRAALPTLDASLKQTIYALAYLLGRQPEKLIDAFIEKKPIPEGAGLVPIGLPSDLLRRRPDVRRAERQLAAATEQIGMAIADLFPHISLTGNTFSGGQVGGSSVGLQSGSLNTFLKAPSRYWSVGPFIRWDVFDFGRTLGQIDVQNSLQRQALLSYEQIIIAALQDVEGALAAYCDEQRRKMYLADQVEAYSRSLALTEDLYQAGLANDLQVLEAKKILIGAQTTLIESEQAVTSDLIALYKALGGDWECSYSP